MNRKKILLVDDEQDILEIISYNLEKEGYMFLLQATEMKVLQKQKKSYQTLFFWM